MKGGEEREEGIWRRRVDNCEVESMGNNRRFEIFVISCGNRD